MLLACGRQIAASALEKRLPTVYGYREHVVAGGLKKRRLVKNSDFVIATANTSQRIV